MWRLLEVLRSSFGGAIGSESFRGMDPREIGRAEVEAMSI